MFLFIWNHPLNKNYRWKSIAKFLSWQSLSYLTHSTIVFPWVEEAKLSLNKGDSGLSGNLYVGLMEYKDMLFLMHLLRDNFLFVDVGANMGSYTVLASKVCNSKTIAFEPIHHSFVRLLEQIKINDIEEKVQAKEIGIGSHSGKLFFTNNLNAMNKVTTECNSPNAIEVPISKLDDEVTISSNCVIKIDVEGYEYDVLKGCQTLLKSGDIIALIIELNSSSTEFGHSINEIHDLIIQNNLTPIDYDPINRTITTLTTFNQDSGNTIYVRDVDEARKLVMHGRKCNIKTANYLSI
jgi:FkbM family methyltransferase